MVEFSHLYADFKADSDDFYLGHGFVSEYFSSSSWNSSSAILLHKSFLSVVFGIWSFFFPSSLFLAEKIFLFRFVSLIFRINWLWICCKLILFSLQIVMCKICWFLDITLILGWFTCWFFLVYLLFRLFQYGSLDC